MTIFFVIGGAHRHQLQRRAPEPLGRSGIAPADDLVDKRRLAASRVEIARAAQQERIFDRLFLKWTPQKVL